MKKYLSLISNQTKLKCIGVILLAFISAFLASLWPVRLGRLYTDISEGFIKTLVQGTSAVLAFGMIYLVSECITIARRVLLDCIIATHESEIRERSIEKLLKMPVSYCHGSMSGEKTAQLNQGVAGFSQLIKIMCNDVFATVLTAACTLVQVLLNAPGIIAVVMILYLVLTVIISVFQIRSQNGVREDIVAQKNTLDGRICESISNLELIRGMHAEMYETKRLLPGILKISYTERRHHHYMGSFDCMKQLCKVSFQVILLAVSVVLISAGEMQSGSVITVCLLFQQLIKPIDEVYRFMDETASSVVKAKALIDVFTSPSDEVFSIQSSNGKMRGSSICIEDVVITSPEKDSCLAWYDRISIPTDMIIALQGANGCGKTSLVRCLTRYYPHTSGRVTLFERDLESYSQKELTKLLYYTPQTSFFIMGTIRENLVFGLDRVVSDEELSNVLERVHLAGDGHGDSVIRKNPMEALEVVLSEKANELSGGMKQRLSLARAFLRSPRLYIFDEITANLDRECTEYVLSEIEGHAREVGAGIVYISHDPKVVSRCNKVINLRNRLKETDPAKNAA